ncbi:hypothetical protein Rleg10DRAFT_5817 [Rhizobium leguminosarum bv. trifolii WSM2012]|nr:hypothetical protein Rleg10DRAFT_4169 [Rhizobium leguminosarum bv. trifolii WSM2012]EJC77123.1 hypothetical protein Rleg10DRAFT_5817 [Rhizobium leguminosarum bv. trifolii WSM2012]
MAFFKSKTFNGNTYDLGHLDPFTLSVVNGEETYRVHVQFGHHCFTEERLGWHSPDRKYEFNGEIRSFCQIRYSASARLPGIIRGLVDKSVYVGKEYNYFVLRNHDLLGNAPAYAVFFTVQQSFNKKKGDVFMRVQSAYQKPNMIDKAPPLTFGYLIGCISTKQQPIPGKAVVIKRT